MMNYERMKVVQVNKLHTTDTPFMKEGEVVLVDVHKDRDDYWGENSILFLRHSKGLSVGDRFKGTYLLSDLSSFRSNTTSRGDFEAMSNKDDISRYDYLVIVRDSVTYHLEMVGMKDTNYIARLQEEMSYE